MELSKQQREVLRWFASGHSLAMVSQFVDLEKHEVQKILSELGVEDRWQAEKLMGDADNIDRIEFNEQGEFELGGQEVPEFKPETPNKNKLNEYNKQEIAKRGGNQIDKIPLSIRQAFSMDVKWRPLSEIKAKWISKFDDEDALKAAVQEVSPSAYKRLYGEDDAS